MAIHPAARVGFAREAEAYERGRPEYPPAAVAWLAAQLRLGPGRTVLDVGAGTGKLTRALARSGARVIAVEPVAQMREVLVGELADVQALEGSAEALPLGDQAVDAVAAGQAYHWFDPVLAPAELARVLRPGGRLGLIWNRRDLGQELQREISQLTEPHRGATPSHADGAWRRGLDASGRFELVAQTEVPFEQELDSDGVVDRVGSISFIAALAQKRRSQLLARVREAALRHPQPLRYITEIYVFAPLSAPQAPGGPSEP
jgi:SAM-dependent methyltransferase